MLPQGILTCVLSDILSRHGKNKQAINESMKLLKALAGNDNVKEKIGTMQGIPVIVSSILNNMVTF
jgi:hypothetical protein